MNILRSLTFKALQDPTEIKAHPRNRPKIHMQETAEMIPRILRDQEKGLRVPLGR